jgi:hypothetical protein
MNGCCGPHFLGTLFGCGSFRTSIDASPRQAAPGQPVQLTGRVDEVFRFLPSDLWYIAWDRDGDGTADRTEELGQPPMLPIVMMETTSFTRPGTYFPGFTAYGDDGRSADTVSVTVDAPAPPGGGQPSPPGGEPSGPGGRPIIMPAQGGRPFTATLRGTDLGPAPPATRRGDVVSHGGAVGRGTLRGRLTPPRRRSDRRVSRLLNGTWWTRVDSRLDLSSASARVSGVGLVKPRRARRGELGCVRYTLRFPAFGPGSGSMTLRGGTGRYARLRTTTRFTLEPRGSVMTLTGTVTSRNARPRGLDRACRSLQRAVRAR